ncbi:MAG: hypothetical protein NW224_18585 [Leptolyngbyaceae cyanobacterium bins.302]|nr:hypothetical protein [Leptolyngbyaceae cyanobacterium bins.302]
MILRHAESESVNIANCGIHDRREDLVPRSAEASYHRRDRFPLP